MYVCVKVCPTQARFRDEEKRSALDEQLFEINYQLQTEKVWFWRFRSPYKDTVPPLLKERKQLQNQIRALDRELKLALAEAKSHIGLWSNQGIQESRDALWSAFRRVYIYIERERVPCLLFGCICISRTMSSPISISCLWIQGSDAARQRSFWDSIYIVLSDRNENAVLTVVRMVKTSQSNFVQVANLNGSRLGRGKEREMSISSVL